MRSATWRVIEIRALRECDDRSQFHLGDPDLDRFIHKFAGENPSRHDVAVTCVAAGHRGILGFAKLAPGRIEFERLPATSRKMLPQYPCPRFGRLVLPSTSRHALGGLGTQRLGLVLKLSVRMANDNGCLGVLVDAKPGAVDFHAKDGFIPVDALEAQSDARPQPMPMFFTMRSIKDGGR